MIHPLLSAEKEWALDRTDDWQQSELEARKLFAASVRRSLLFDYWSAYQNLDQINLRGWENRAG
jgi:hypothetical protein